MRHAEKILKWTALDSSGAILSLTSNTSFYHKNNSNEETQNEIGKTLQKLKWQVFPFCRKLIG